MSRPAVHKNWIQNRVRTSTCDFCNRRYIALQKCGTCSINVCKDCLDNGSLETDPRHMLPRNSATNFEWYQTAKDMSNNRRTVSGQRNRPGTARRPGVAASASQSRRPQARRPQPRTPRPSTPRPSTPRPRAPEHQTPQYPQLHALHPQAPSQHFRGRGASLPQGGNGQYPLQHAPQIPPMQSQQYMPPPHGQQAGFHPHYGGQPGNMHMSSYRNHLHSPSAYGGSQGYGASAPQYAPHIRYAPQQHPSRDDRSTFSRPLPRAQTPQHQSQNTPDPQAPDIQQQATQAPLGSNMQVEDSKSLETRASRNKNKKTKESSLVQTPIKKVAAAHGKKRPRVVFESPDEGSSSGICKVPEHKASSSPVERGRGVQTVLSRTQIAKKLRGNKPAKKATTPNQTTKKRACLPAIVPLKESRVITLRVTSNSGKDKLREIIEGPLAVSRRAVPVSQSAPTMQAPAGNLQENEDPEV